jgi:hypothetical protein
LLSIANDDTIRIWDWQKGSEVQRVHVGNIGLQCAVMTGSKVVYGCRNGTMHEWTLGADKALSTWAENLGGYEWEVVKVMAADGNIVRGKVQADGASTEMDMHTEVRVWNISP